MAKYSHQGFSHEQLMALAKVEPYLDQYEATKGWQLKQGVGVRDYVATALSDAGSGYIGDLATDAVLDEALKLLEKQYGTPASPANWLASGLGQDA